MNNETPAGQGNTLSVEQVKNDTRPVTSSRRLPLIAIALVLGSMCSIQFGAALSEPIMTLYGSFGTTWLRLCLASAVLVIIVRPPLHTYGQKQWLIALALGAAMACMTLFFFAALQRIPLGLAIAIEFLGPLCVATLGVRSIVQLIWPIVAGVGVLLLARQGGAWDADPQGIVFAVAAAFGWGCYILLMKKAGAQFKGLEGLCMSLIVAALLATPLGIIDGSPLSSHRIYMTAGLAVLVPLLPYVLELTALRMMPTSLFGILMSAEPVIGAIAGFVVLNQSMTPMQCLGTACVVVASIGAVKASD